MEKAMPSTAITGWDSHIAAGRRYLKTARNGRSRPEVFNNELIFQLAAMAIERLLVGVCQYHQQMPVDHTLSGLVQDLNRVCPVAEDLVRCIQEVERIDDMCPLTASFRPEPDPSAIEKILEAGACVVDFAKTHVPWNIEAEG